MGDSNPGRGLRNGGGGQANRGSGYSATDYPFDLMRSLRVVLHALDPHVFELLIGGTHMKYMMLVYLDEQAMSESEREHCYVESAQFAQQLNSSGQYLDASPLHPVSTATSVRVRDGKRLVTDGPFAETREQLGGYYLIDAGDLDEAIRIAERIPPARFGTIEIRPVLEIQGLPTD